MTAAALMLACASTLFVEMDVPGLRLGEPDPLSGRLWRNYRHADIDGDGNVDLVLPDRVVFQRQGIFRREDSAPIPHAEESPSADVWGPEIYLRRARELLVLRWRDDGWQEALRQEIAWPEKAREDAGEGLPETGSASGLQWERFLHDLNGDGRPEVVLAAEDGLHVFRLRPEGYRREGVADVFPPMELVPVDVSLWPPPSRHVRMPRLSMGCRVVVDGAEVAVIEPKSTGYARIAYRTYRYTLDVAAGFAVSAPRIESSESMPEFMRPCRLNDDGALDYAGGAWSMSSGAVAPTPIYEVFVSTDGGVGIQRFRAPSFVPRCLFIDYDGDGRLDLVQEVSGLFEGGAREMVTRMLTATTIRHEVRIHRQTAEGAFPREPDLRARIALDLGEPPIQGGDMFLRYQAGELIDLTGDFNGDGYRDLLVRDRPERLALHLGGARGFARTPTTTIPVRREWRFAVDDVDRDGRSDIVVHWSDAERPDGGERCRVLLTRELPR